MNQNKLWWIGGGVIVVVGSLCAICAICVVVGSLVPGSTGKRVPQVAQLEEPTATIEATTPPPTSTPSPSPTAMLLPTDTPVPSPTPKYVPVLAKIWTGVKVYYGQGDEKAYGFEVLGGSEDCPSIPSGKGLFVRYPDGNEEWKDRAYIVESGDFFVLTDDPAIPKLEWYEYPCF